jgi:hypothetical protein
LRATGAQEESGGEKSEGEFVRNACVQIKISSFNSLFVVCMTVEKIQRQA